MTGERNLASESDVQKRPKFPTQRRIRTGLEVFPGHQASLPYPKTGKETYLPTYLPL